MTRTFSGLIVALMLSAPAANAGSLNDPIVANDVVVADAVATSSAAGTGLLLMLAAVMVLAATD